MVVSPNSLSLLRYFKFIAVLIADLIGYFNVCNCSEDLDECNARVRQALIMSDWHACKNVTKRDFVMLVRRVQISNHVKFCIGAFVVNRIFFTQVLNVAYTFVNFMRIKQSGQVNVSVHY